MEKSTSDNTRSPQTTFDVAEAVSVMVAMAKLTLDNQNHETVSPLPNTSASEAVTTEVPLLITTIAEYHHCEPLLEKMFPPPGRPTKPIFRFKLVVQVDLDGEMDELLAPRDEVKFVPSSQHLSIISKQCNPSYGNGPMTTTYPVKDPNETNDPDDFDNNQPAGPYGPDYAELKLLVLRLSRQENHVSHDTFGDIERQVERLRRLKLLGPDDVDGFDYFTTEQLQHYREEADVIWDAMFADEYFREFFIDQTKKVLIASLEDDNLKLPYNWPRSIFETKFKSLVRGINNETWTYAFFAGYLDFQRRLLRIL
ncbi:uncharacterized protein BCR38DRAFT_522963 [Pseudomassariella vexata]|uniref:Uncharacterized protein n=1 Tax=Pseudomassariella vexata TaxID=1141098 RepID=A0A1Y2E438_9PEZI|nr:uncharacterized protein BCR38DRAFT_522963 [Pseudomassariella vexata]ORY66114.1 hypothetical protein BCR38DRAFT_522963 [Pseudomassariella vexata]